MRTLKLSHEEIQLIEKALGFFYHHKFMIVQDNARVLTEDEKQTILNDANLYDDLGIAIRESAKDV